MRVLYNGEKTDQPVVEVSVKIVPIVGSCYKTTIRVELAGGIQPTDDVIQHFVNVYYMNVMVSETISVIGDITIRTKTIASIEVCSVHHLDMNQSEVQLSELF